MDKTNHLQFCFSRFSFLVSFFSSLLLPSQLVINAFCPAGFAVCAGEPRRSMPCWMEAWREVHEARP